MLPVSKDTLLRMVRRRARVPSDRLNVIGIDDWARRRNHSYGTIVCDLERRRPVTLARSRYWSPRRRGGEFLFGSDQHVFTLTGALVRQQRIAAGR